MEMTPEVKQAYEWALNQQFESVAARNARTLARYIQSSVAVEHIVAADGACTCGHPWYPTHNDHGCLHWNCDCKQPRR